MAGDTTGQDGGAGRGASPLGPLLTVAEVAESLRVSGMTVYRLINQGELPALRVGKNLRIRVSDLETFLAARTVVGDEEANG